MKVNERPVQDPLTSTEDQVLCTIYLYKLIMLSLNCCMMHFIHHWQPTAQSFFDNAGFRNRAIHPSESARSQVAESPSDLLYMLWRNVYFKHQSNGSETMNLPNHNMYRSLSGSKRELITVIVITLVKHFHAATIFFLFFFIVRYCR